MTHTHTLAEWAAMLDIAASGFATFSVFYFLLVDADRTDFTLRQLLDNTAGARLLVEIVRARDTFRATRRQAALWLAALLILTIPTGDPR